MRKSQFLTHNHDGIPLLAVSFNCSTKEEITKAIDTNTLQSGQSLSTVDFARLSQ